MVLGGDRSVCHTNPTASPTPTTMANLELLVFIHGDSPPSEKMFSVIIKLTDEEDLQRS